MAGLEDEPVLLAKLEQLLGGRDQVPICFCFFSPFFHPYALKE
jgi:hypothetical protein